MSIKSFLSKPFASIVVHSNRKWMADPVASQKRVFGQLLQSASATSFGVEHSFNKIRSYIEFTKAVPVRDYEGLRHYIDRIIAGEKNVLWPGLPLYFAKTSGTTSGAKYIPISRDSMPYHIRAARDALLWYIYETGNTLFVNGKMIFLQGSPVLDRKGVIPAGRLSGIVAHYVPRYLLRNRLPSWETNCIDDWETKVRAISGETVKEDMRLISGIPSWVMMYFDLLLEMTGKKKIMEIFPHFSLFVYGGLAYEPYRTRLESVIGKRIDSIETYPASEGFIAYQNSQKEEGLLLLLNSAIFYEFIPTGDYYSTNPKRLSIEEVETGVNYALVMSTNAGLWAYSIGDTVKFISVNPYKIVVTGRISHYTSAFGEHVIAEEVEYALQKVCSELNIRVVEFHVAPQITPPGGGLPYHEWFIEFDGMPVDLNNFASAVDHVMQKKNIYYDDLIKGKVLRPLKITPVMKNGFADYMKQKGKLGGQNKVQRLANDRAMADGLSAFILTPSGKQPDGGKQGGTQ